LREVAQAAALFSWRGFALHQGEIRKFQEDVCRKGTQGTHREEVALFLLCDLLRSFAASSFSFLVAALPRCVPLRQKLVGIASFLAIAL